MLTAEDASSGSRQTERCTMTTDSVNEQRHRQSSSDDLNDTTTLTTAITTPDQDAQFDTAAITITNTDTMGSGSISSNNNNNRLQEHYNSSQITLPFSDSGGSSHHDEYQQQHSYQPQQQVRYNVTAPAPVPERTIVKRPSDESIRSNFSTTSSVFSTASKISRLPHAVKSSFVSVKDFMKSNRSRAKRLTISHGTPSSNDPVHQQQQQQPPHSPQFSPQTIHYSTPGTSPYSDRESLASRFRRRTPSTMGLASMFSSASSSSTSNNNHHNKEFDHRYGPSPSSGISPSASTSYSILEVKDPHHAKYAKPRTRHIIPAVASTTTTTSNSGNHRHNGRRNSVVGVATRFLKRDHTNNNNSKNNDPSQNNHGARISAINEEGAAAAAAEYGFSDDFEQAIRQEDDEEEKVEASLSSTGHSPANQKAVGKLLFGVDIEHQMEFFDNDFRKSATSSTISAADGYDLESAPPSSDAKSDHITSKSSTHEIVWSRQRAKSCQVNKNKKKNIHLHRSGEADDGGREKGELDQIG
ncbi:hypothetical protein BDB00DRAFT_19035 [Zychaea mexicana]|uniref:uncharacterized protein n=1 Tax=Zychaea mexicana TaxID=64656 RepID=UPI0022FEDB8A|nr:uncharacterized protein BDB00DRAFT_19035 [Zychaea mexicana]KAI9497195.1 hypothetical protein BDB00DRAFT_19035 [Zychaea mexicana]